MMAREKSFVSQRVSELLEYKIAVKLSCASERLQKCLPTVLNNGNLTAVFLLDATLVSAEAVLPNKYLEWCVHLS